MGADTITVTEEQVEQARTIVNQSAASHGLDMEHEGTKEFLELQAQNRASNSAWDLFNQNIIHQVTEQGHWAPGGCKFIHVETDEETK